MKTTKLIISAFFLLFIFMGAGCKKEKNGAPLKVEGYIVGSFISDEVNKLTGQATGNKTQRGFCILLVNSKNVDNQWPMDFYTFKLPQSLFNFPENILTPLYNGNNCGPTFFPENLKNVYKIRFEYDESLNEDEIKFVNGCTAFFQSFPWEDFAQVNIKNVSQY